jgi:hypothetical protein
MRKYLIGMILLLTVLIPLNSSSAQESDMTMSIGGDVKKPRQWSAKQLNAQFADQIKEVKFWDKLPSWKERSGSGIPLYSLIKTAEPMIEKETRWTKRDRADAVLHSHMTFLVILEARDSFLAFFL